MPRPFGLLFIEMGRAPCGTAAALILIIAAIAIPDLLRSRIAANEASAVGSLRTINTAEVTYASIRFWALPLTW